MMLEIISLPFFLLYGLLLLTAAWYASLPRLKKNNAEQNLRSVSVIVPFRNEKPHLHEIMNSLASQQYNGTMEFIFSDDHSDDGSAEVIQEHLSPGVIYLSPLPGIEGKKAAITRAYFTAF